MGAKRVAVIGLGNMGEALVKGLLDRGLVAAEDLAGAEKVAARGAEVAERHGVTLAGSLREACTGADVVVLAVKPQDAGGALEELAASEYSGLVLSICAGVPLSRLAEPLPAGTPVVRAMPNTPALVGCGASVYCGNRHLTSAHRGIVESLLGALGAVYAVDDERHLDAVTGLSGSGPAYVFVFLEALADGGVLMGLPRTLARALAVQTVLGAAKLAQGEGAHLAELKDRVASPGGTTIAGLRELEARGFRAATIEAVRAATQRSRELGG